MESIELATERLALRSVEAADAEVLWAIRRSPWVSQWWGDGSAEPDWPMDSDETEHCFAIWRDGTIVGLIQYYEIDGSSRHAGIDLFLSESASRQGLGREAILRVMRFLVDERGHHRIVIDPSTANSRAIATYEACGFTRVGVMRQYERNMDGPGWHDGLFMEYVEQ